MLIMKDWDEKSEGQSDDFKSKYDCHQFSRFMILSCVIISPQRLAEDKSSPFGCPVVPLVYKYPNTLFAQI